MTLESRSPSSPRTDFRARLVPRLQRSDPYLMRVVQGAALIGCILGVLIYSWNAVHTEKLDARRALAEAAAVGQVAAEADLARIDAAAAEAAPLIAAALAGDVSPARQRAMRADVVAALARTPVTAIVIFNENGQAMTVFGELPSDAAGRIAPRSASQRAGGELLDLELAPLASGRAAYYRHLKLADGSSRQAALVLRTGAFQAALQVGSAAGSGWRSALLNRDGETVLTGITAERAFTSADARLAVDAVGWRPLHGDESAADGRVNGEEGAFFIETRAVAGDMLQLVFVGEAPAAFSILASRRFEFLALLGAALMSVVLAVSVIQNEWQRHDRHVRDADLAAARADVTCDLLSAGVVDWSVSDGVVDYSEGWADLFAQGSEPVSEQIFDWVARIHPDDRAAVRTAYQDMLDGGQTELVHRIRVRLSSGLWVQVIERGRAIAGVDGKTKRIVLVQTIEPVDGSALRSAFDGLSQSQDGGPSVPKRMS